MLFFKGKKQDIERGLHRTRETYFSRLASLIQNRNLSNESWELLEETLISSDISMATSSTILRTVQERLKVNHSAHAVNIIKEELLALLETKCPNVMLKLESATPRVRPLVVLVVGVNGSGKTTSLAKLTYMFQKTGNSVLLAAADTFRAGAIEQIQAWAKLLNVDVIANMPKGDPGAVAFDAVQAGKARGADVVMIDTAGRLHTNTNLMNELSKIRRVVQRLDPEAPHITLLVIDATTGQNGLRQASEFTEIMDCDGIILAKLDGTAKGGVVFDIYKELRVPILFIGTGEKLEDLTPFDSKQFVDALFTTTVTGSSK